eukprot:1322093-Amphidinium_carterae.1
METGSVPQCSDYGTFHEVIGCNYEGCSLGCCPSHSIYVLGVGGGFWCLRHKDNISLDSEYSIINRPLGAARTYCVTCYTEVWPENYVLASKLSEPPLRQALRAAREGHHRSRYFQLLGAYSRSKKP